MEIANLLTGGLLSEIMDVLKGTGLVKDADAQARMEALLLDKITQQQTFFLDYFKATIGQNEPWYSPSKLFRPLCSFTVIICYMIGKFYQIQFTPVDTILIGGIVGFWFGGRTIEKLFNKAQT